MSSKRVVVTGVGVVSPIGIGAAAFWNALLAGQSGIGRISAFDPAGFPCQIAGQIAPYKIGDFVPKSYRKATKVMARDIELAVIAADDAMKDAGLQTRAYLDPSPINSLRFGCNIGAGLISADLVELASAMNVARSSAKPDALDLHKWGTDGMSQLTPLWLLKYLPNMLACHVTIIHGLMGPSNTITCQEASSHLAIGEAFRTIQRGKADLAICGGAESRLNPMGLTRQHLLKRLTTMSNESPATALKPFDESSTGSVLGEGGGLLILEEYEHAKARGAKIYAELAGFGASQDTHNPTEPDPTGYSYGKAVAKALVDASAAATDVDLVIPHGTGHAATDSAELNGFKAVFGDGLARPMFAPIKAQTGNPIAGCGVDVVATVLSLHHGKAPPAVNTNSSVLNVSKTARDAAVQIAVSSTCSVGGQNAALVFRKT
jgi:3-oxoacyl-[acyl-carrier-protein] synthase II